MGIIGMKENRYIAERELDRQKEIAKALYAELVDRHLTFFV